LRSPSSHFLFVSENDKTVAARSQMSRAPVSSQAPSPPETGVTFTTDRGRSVSAKTGPPNTNLVELLRSGHAALALHGSCAPKHRIIATARQTGGLAKEMTGWKSIESAPKDGRPLLLFATLKTISPGLSNKPVPVVGHWHRAIERWKVWPDHLGGGAELLPTHWAWIPAPLPT
jgi:hypothetical protein